LVVTDGMEMRAASHGRDTSKVALYSLMAGNDILEIPVDVKKSIDEIVKAVESGLVSKRYIEKKCKKILEAKYDLGLHKGFTPINPSGILSKLNTDQARLLRNKLSEASLTLLSNKDVLPLSSGNAQYIEIGQGEIFKEQLAANGVAAAFSMDVSDTKEHLDSLAAGLKPGTLVLGCHSVPRGRTAFDYGLNSPMLDFMDRLARDHKLVLVFFGNPYALANLGDLERFSSIIVAYDNAEETQLASAKALLGKLGFEGKLPVTVNENFREGFGIVLP